MAEDLYADPGRLHAEGRAARVTLEYAREQVAEFVDAKPREVVFASTGTESIAMALRGVIAKSPGHVVTTAVEHSAVRDTIDALDVECTTIPVDGLGRYDAAA